MLTFVGAMTPMEGTDSQTFNNSGVRLHVDRIVELVAPGDLFLFHTDGTTPSFTSHNASLMIDD